MNTLSDKMVWMLNEIAVNERYAFKEDLEDGMYDVFPTKEAYAMGFRDGLVDLAQEILRNLEVQNATQSKQEVEQA